MEQVRIKITHPGSLKKYGYSSKDPFTERAKALKKAEAVYGKQELIRKLNAAAVLNEHNPSGRIFRSDVLFLEKNKK